MSVESLGGKLMFTLRTEFVALAAVFVVNFSMIGGSDSAAHAGGNDRQVKIHYEVIDPRAIAKELAGLDAEVRGGNATQVKRELVTFESLVGAGWSVSKIEYGSGTYYDSRGLCFAILYFSHPNADKLWESPVYYDLWSQSSDLAGRCRSNANVMQLPSQQPSR
jgi:hypothetical protein